MCGGDAACSQITLITCYYLHTYPLTFKTVTWGWRHFMRSIHNKLVKSTAETDVQNWKLQSLKCKHWKYIIIHIICFLYAANNSFCAKVRTSYHSVTAEKPKSMRNQQLDYMMLQHHRLAVVTCTAVDGPIVNFVISGRRRISTWPCI